MPIHCAVEVLDPHAHLFGVTLTVHNPQPRQRLSLPVWIPGSYMVREFAQHLQRLEATLDGHPIACTQLNKNTWEAQTQGGDTPLQLRYQVYAFDASVRTAYLDQTRAFFNPTSLCLRAWGHEEQPHTLALLDTPHTQGWKVATGLPACPTDGDRCYLATQGYDQLADSPCTWAAFWAGEFTAQGIPHRFVITGAGPGFDGDRLLQDTQRICEAQIAFWHGQGNPPPYTAYTFMLHASADGYGGLEHGNSTALICQRNDLPQRQTQGIPPPALKASDGYTGLLGLISHEYFHTWNVKRLRPLELNRYDYERENHTHLLWFFEGFTSYYDDLFLRRTGLIDDNTYLQLVAKTINQVLQTPGRFLQSVAQASFDAWTKYYRVNENTPNQTVSYYTKGALIALCLDLTLRLEGLTSLDEVMREVYQVCQGGPMSEQQLLATLNRLGKRHLGTEIQAWVHGTGELPLQDLCQRVGLQWTTEQAPLAQRLGIRVGEAGGNLVVKGVLRGSCAEAAGLAAGDEWLGVTCNPDSTDTAAEWRIRKLDDVAQLAPPANSGPTALGVLFARDGRLLRGRLVWPDNPPPLVVIRPTPSPTQPPEAAPWQRWLQG